MYYSGKDYCVDLDLKSVIDGNELNLKGAWKSFNLFNSPISSLKSIDLTIGKISYPFGNVSSKASKNISLLQPKTFGADFMVKLSGNICNLHTLIFYWADKGNIFGTTDSPAHIGFRGTTTYIKGLDLGISFRIREFSEDDKLFDYGVDISYTLKNMVKLDYQDFNLDDGDDDIDDLDLWFIATYVSGFNVPVLKKITPYLGFFSKRDLVNDELKGDALKQNNIILGINIVPKENTFIKLEYNIDSLDKKDYTDETKFPHCSDALCVQVGFLF